MKKILALVLALALMSTLLAACQDSPADETAPTQTTTENTEPTENTAPDTTPEPTLEVAPEDAEELPAYEPDYSFYSEGLDDQGYFAGVVASDYVTLPAYKGQTIPRNAIEPDEQDIWQMVEEEVLPYYAETAEITDRAIVDGDTVNIDYVGYIDDVAFDGGNTQGQGTEVTIGVTQYIDDFLEQLIGHTPGETFDIFVTFPEDYGVENLNGQEARFNITVNYIVERELPQDLTDEMAQDMGFDDREALLARVKDMLLTEARSVLLTDILEGTVCEEVPESVMAYFENYMVGYYSNYYGMDISEMKDTLLSSLGDSLRTMAVDALAIQAIAEQENLQPTEEDLIDIGIYDLLDVYGRPFAMQAALSDKLVPELIIANGTVE